MSSRLNRSGHDELMSRIRNQLEINKASHETTKKSLEKAKFTFQNFEETYEIANKNFDEGTVTFNSAKTELNTAINQMAVVETGHEKLEQLVLEFSESRHSLKSTPTPISPREPERTEVGQTLGAAGTLAERHDTSEITEGGGGCVHFFDGRHHPLSLSQLEELGLIQKTAFPYFSVKNNVAYFVTKRQKIIRDEMYGFACFFCGNKFYTRENTEAHMLEHHLENEVECKLCQRKTFSLFEQQVHDLQKHPNRDKEVKVEKSVTRKRKNM